MASRFLAPFSSARSNWLPEPLFQLQREIDRAFEDAFSGGAGGSGSSGTSMMNAPRIDLHEADGELCLRADLPGIQPSDLDVRVEGDVLTIRGERKSENERNEQNFHVMERSHGRFQRSIQLPFTPNPDEVHAEVRHGVLEVRIPKHAPQERSRRIEVRGGDAQQGSGSQAIAGGAQSTAGGAGASMTHAVGGGGAGSQGAGSTASSGSSSGGGGAGGASGNASSAGSTGQGPGGASSVTPGVGSGAQGGRGSEGGLAGTSGGPTAAPAGETSSSR